MVQYLEHGTGEFIPVVTSVLERFSSRERQPFIRVLDIWAERHVLSRKYVEKLKVQWSAHTREGHHVERADDSSASSTNIRVDETPHRPQLHKLYHGEPKLVDPRDISHRLVHQSKVTATCVRDIRRSMSEISSNMIPITQADIQTPVASALSGLRVSLSAEILVCVVFPIVMFITRIYFRCSWHSRRLI